MADELVFYTNPMSRGRIVRWMLEETGAAYETRIVDYGGMKSAEHLAVNPMGKVPVVVHNGNTITECAAICAYLADAFPDAGLAPAPADRAAYYRWLFFAAGPLEAAVVNKALGVEVTDEQVRMVGYGNYGFVLDTLQEAIPAEGYIAGEHFTAADVYVGSHIGWGLQFGSIDERPGFAEYFARISNRDAYRRAEDLDNEATENKG